ncbi:hypothetical protein [Microbaculum sp. FT89]|uniref:hypothetical protein n=1 Tax=Microbaculum sp. FT89 TaxID=3447298 RepID=UPI003F52F2FD
MLHRKSRAKSVQRRGVVRKELKNRGFQRSQKNYWAIGTAKEISAVERRAIIS